MKSLKLLMFLVLAVVLGHAQSSHTFVDLTTTQALPGQKTFSNIRLASGTPNGCVYADTNLQLKTASIDCVTGRAPAGGATGYVLTKNTGTDYDYSWQPGSSVTGALNPRPPIAVPNGQAVSWAYSSTCALEAQASNGWYQCGKNAGTVYMGGNCPLCDNTQQIGWSGFTMPTLPGDAVIQGIYPVFVVTNSSSNGVFYYANAWCGPANQWAFTNLLGPFGGQYNGSSIGNTAASVTGASCHASLYHTLNISGTDTFAIQEVGLAIYYTTATPPSQSGVNFPYYIDASRQLLNAVPIANGGLGLTAIGGSGTAPVSNGTAYVSTDIATQAELDAHTSSTAAHGATGAVVGTTNSQTIINKTFTLPILTSYTVAGLPAAASSTSMLAIVTDALTAGSCTTGGGTGLAFCRSNGSSWVPLGDGGSGGGGNTTSTSLSVNRLPKANGANSIIDSLLSDDGTTLSYTGTGGISAPKVSTTGSAAGYYGLGQGTAQSIVANTIGLTAPTSVTGYNVVFPSAAATGIPHWTNAAGIVTTTISPVAKADIASADIQGTGAKLMSAGTVSGTGASLCTDANGAATTSGCPGASFDGVTDFLTYKRTHIWPRGDTAGTVTDGENINTVVNSGSLVQAQVVPSATNPLGITFTTKATPASGDYYAVYSGNSQWAPGLAVDFVQYTVLTSWNGASSNLRAWWGFSNTSAAVKATANDTISDQTAAFFICNDTGASCPADNTNFMCVARDGASTSGYVDSGVAADANKHKFQIHVATNGAVTFKIDGTTVCASATQTITTATTIRWLWTMNTLEAAQKSWTLYGQLFQEAW